MLAAALEARGDPQQGRFRDAFGCHHVDELRASFGERAGLVEDERIDAAQLLDRLGVAEQHARSRAAAHRDRDRDRRRESERARTRDDQHGDRIHERVRQARLGPDRGPHREGGPGGEHDRGHEPARHAIGEALDRGAAALRLRDERHDAREQRLAAHLLGAHHEASRAVHAARHDAVPGTLRDRDRLAREHRFVDAATALEHHAIHRQLLARSHAQLFTDADARERDVDFAAVLEQAARGCRRETEQRADRASRASPRPQLEQLAEEHERHDHGGGLEVDRDAAAVAAEGSRIRTRSERREQAVAPGGAGPERDQREHVELSRPQRAPGALEERLASPEHDGRREQQLDPRERRRGNGVREAGSHEHFRHREREQGKREQAAQPEAAAHVEQFGARFVAERRRHRLERHPADRTRARGVAHDLGVHRTGETHRRRRRRRGSPGGRSQPTLGLRAEALAAAIAAEAVADAGVLEPTRALPVDAHAAHGIARGRHSRVRRRRVGFSRHGESRAARSRGRGAASPPA